MFPIAGNPIEGLDDRPGFENYVFRNGITISVRTGLNGSSEELYLDTQRALAIAPNARICPRPLSALGEYANASWCNVLSTTASDR
jgi:hypothetical protein